MVGTCYVAREQRVAEALAKCTVSKSVALMISCSLCKTVAYHNLFYNRKNLTMDYCSIVQFK